MVSERFDDAIDAIPDRVLDQMDLANLPHFRLAKDDEKEAFSRNSPRGGLIVLDRADSGKAEFDKAFYSLQTKRGVEVAEKKAEKKSEKAPGSESIAAPPLTKIRSLAPEIGTKPKEIFVLLDANGNELYDRHQSTVSGGDVPSEWNLEGNHIVHNHPSALKAGNNGFGATFSDADIITAVSRKMGSVTAIAGRRTYIMEPPVGGWGTNAATVRKSYNRNLKRRVSEVVSRVRAGRMTEDQAILIAGHRTWKDVASEFGFRYTVVRGG
jgi:hypothetical protein